jgi:organic hydroperoxide reductase OsmC/OhrA
VSPVARPRTTAHHVTQRWVGDDGNGTRDDDFGRDGELTADGRPTIPTGPTPAYRGAPGSWSPEDLLAGAVSQCTMLWFLHLCQRNAVVVSSYVDDVTATLVVAGSRGEVSEIALDVTVGVAVGDDDLVRSLFEKANDLCYVARSLTTDVVHRLRIEHTQASV